MNYEDLLKENNILKEKIVLLEKDLKECRHIIEQFSKHNNNNNNSNNSNNKLTNYNNKSIEDQFIVYS